MEDKKILYVALALVGGIMVGYMTGGSKISGQDQGASVRTSKVSDAVMVKEEVDPAVLSEAISKAPEDAETVTVMNKNGVMVTQAVPKELFLIGGHGGSDDVWFSPNGTSWTLATSNAVFGGGRQGNTSVFFKNKLWVLGGSTNITSYNNDIWSSSNGVNWTQETVNAAWSDRREHTSLVFNNKMWVIGGYVGSGIYKNDVWSSNDGINWTQVTANTPWSARGNHSSVVFNNKMWVMGGYDPYLRNDVWSSADGLNWTQETVNASWSPRMQHTSVVFNNKIWVMGGWNNSTTNDVWSSNDGINWVQVTPNAAWSPRISHASVTANGKMWVIGGNANNSNGYFNDAWSSFNGTTWTQEIANAPWTERSSHSVVKTPLTFGQILINFINASTKLTSVTGNNNDSGDFVINFEIHAPGSDIYIPSIVNPTTTNAIDFAVLKKNVGEINVTQYASGVTAMLTTTTGAPMTSNGNYKIDGGQTEGFTLAVHLTNGGSLAAGQYRTRINNIRFNLDDSNIVYANYTSVANLITNWLYVN